MPIKFRCQHCQQFLGISRSKARSLTDCPTCGRTIRVPDLDGTVAPLPPPKLDLADSELRNALGALADLEMDTTGPAQPEPSSQPSIDQNQKDQDVPIIVADPIAPAELDLTKTANPSEFDASQGTSAALADLANAEYAIPIIENDEEPRRIPWRFITAASIIFFLIGFLLGRLSVSTNISSGRRSGEVKSPILPADPQVSKDEEKPFENLSAQVSGRITYETKAGETRNDHGARILILPILKRDQTKLASDGFQIGTSPAAQESFHRQVSEMGGYYTLADSDGTFFVTGLSADRYIILIGSKFQPRDELHITEKNLNQFLENYFENPQRVLGSVQYYFQEIEIESDPEDSPIVIEMRFENS